MILTVRTDSDPAAMAASIRNAVRAIDPIQPVARVATMEEILAGAIAQPRFNTLLLTLFAGIALLLAAIGIYGVMALSVARRAHEIGIRMAIGARRSDVLRMIVGQGMRLALIGLAIGVAASFAISRALASLLFGVTPADPVTFLAVGLLFLFVALAASYVPARRATRIDPMATLRGE